MSINKPDMLFYSCCFRALLINGDCIEAKKYNILHRLVRESGYEEAATEIGDLIVTIDRIESKNAYLYYNLSALFCRVVRFHPFFYDIHLKKRNSI